MVHRERRPSTRPDHPRRSHQRIPDPRCRRQPLGLIVGPDKTLWFSEVAGNRVGRASANGQVAEYDVPTPNAGVLRLAAGPDDAVWFVEARAQVLARITADGQITEFPAVDVAAGPGVTAGPDGAVWFKSFSGNRIEGMTLDGEVSPYAVPTENSYPYHILSGPDGAVWFTEMDGNATRRLALDPANAHPLCTDAPAETQKVACEFPRLAVQIWNHQRCPVQMLLRQLEMLGDYSDA